MREKTRAKLIERSKEQSHPVRKRPLSKEKREIIAPKERVHNLEIKRENQGLLISSFIPTSKRKEEALKKRADRFVQQNFLDLKSTEGAELFTKVILPIWENEEMRLGPNCRFQLSGSNANPETPRKLSLYNNVGEKKGYQELLQETKRLYKKLSKETQKKFFLNTEMDYDHLQKLNSHIALTMDYESGIVMGLNRELHKDLTKARKLHNRYTVVLADPFSDLKTRSNYKKLLDKLLLTEILEDPKHSELKLRKKEIIGASNKAHDAVINQTLRHLNKLDIGPREGLILMKVRNCLLSAYEDAKNMNRVLNKNLNISEDSYIHEDFDAKFSAFTTKTTSSLLFTTGAEGLLKDDFESQKISKKCYNSLRKNINSIKFDTIKQLMVIIKKAEKMNVKGLETDVGAISEGFERNAKHVHSNSSWEKLDAIGKDIGLDDFDGQRNLVITKRTNLNPYLK